MGGLQGWQLVIIIVLVVLLFAAPKLPGMARNLGQSMRVFKSEVKQMKDDGRQDDADGEHRDDRDGARSTDAVEGRIVDGDARDSRDARGSHDTGSHTGRDGRGTGSQHSDRP